MATPPPPIFKGGQGGPTSKKHPPKSPRTGAFRDRPPTGNRLKSRRFSSATASRSTFRAKRTANRPWSMPDGMTTRSLSWTGCGQARRGWKGRCYPPAGGSDDPPQKLGPPSGPPPLCVTGPPVSVRRWAPRRLGKPRTPRQRFINRKHCRCCSDRRAFLCQLTRSPRTIWDVPAGHYL
jgi:hypothetical protein